MSDRVAIPVNWFSKAWVCMVVRGGYHNGSHCTPDDPHSGWGCSWRHEVSLNDDDWKAITDAH